MGLNKITVVEGNIFLSNERHSNTRTYKECNALETGWQGEGGRQGDDDEVNFRIILHVSAEKRM